MTAWPTVPAQELGARAVLAPTTELVPFVRGGVLDATAAHAARELCRLLGDERAEVQLAVGLAVRAPLHGHVCVDLRDTETLLAGLEADADAPGATDVDPATLPWPEPDRWYEVLRDSPLVRVRPPGTPRDPEPARDRPLALVDERLYLDRFWRYERRVAAVLAARAARTRTVDAAVAREAIARLLPSSADTPRPDRQRLAVATAALRDLAVVAGGPGTGKTHTVARLLALLHELHGTELRVAACAPTGKAADQLTGQLHRAAARIATSAEVRARLAALQATTIHRLLGWQPGSPTRFRHGREHKLPYDVVVVDETSMVSLQLMAKLLVALRPATQLVLVGDPDQLASVEAGAVLGDIVGPSGDGLRATAATRDRLAAVTGEPLDDVTVVPDDHGIDDAVVVLGRVHRFGERSGIAGLARAIHAGDADAAVELLRGAREDLTWHPTPVGELTSDDPGLLDVRSRATAVVRDATRAAADGDAPGALAALDRLRLLCAHRRGPAGARDWVARVEAWTGDLRLGHGQWYVGRPVLVTRNDPRLGLFNGDVGVTVHAPDGAQVAFRTATGVRLVAPSRLADVETVHATTIHKSQGSQYDEVVVVLPEPESRVLTRELLYTAVTRARTGVTVLGAEASLRAGIARRVSRASGLRATLWPGAGQ